jgi:hypothetical protein
MKDNKKNIQEELSEISPFLAQLKADETPIETFNVPNDYFNQLAHNIFDRTILQEETLVYQQVEPTRQHVNTSTQRSFLRYFQWLWNPGTAVVLTSVLILVVSGIYLMNQESTDYGNDLTAADIEQYIEANIDNFEIEQLASLIANDEVVDFELPVELPNVEAEEIEEYIEENFIDDLGINDLK